MRNFELIPKLQKAQVIGLKTLNFRHWVAGMVLTACALCTQIQAQERPFGAYTSADSNAQTLRAYSTGTAQADSALNTQLSPDAAMQALSSVRITKKYALGIHRFDLDAHTEVLGWQVGKRLYFGRQDGEDSGLSLVWQKQLRQVSLSKEGIRLTQRF